jgi:hypothetical protein
MITYQRLFIIICLAFTSLTAKKPATSAITNDTQTGGRLGDQLILYWKAKVLADMYDMPFFYTPFREYGEDLMMSKKENRLNKAKIKTFKNIVRINATYNCEKKLNRNNNTLYLLDFHAPVQKLGFHFGYNKKGIQQHLKKMLQPLKPPMKIFRPKTILSVAVHVRTGGGYDTVSEKRGGIAWQVLYPCKFAPTSFYINQMKYLYELLGKKPFYVHIFTDDQQPQRIAQEFKNALKDLPITFATRTEGNAHNANVIDDFIAMTQFDCIIRPQSGLSKMAEFIGNPSIAIIPKKAHWENGTIVVNEVKVIKKIKSFYGKSHKSITTYLC